MKLKSSFWSQGTTFLCVIAVVSAVALSLVPTSHHKQTEFASPTPTPTAQVPVLTARNVTVTEHNSGTWPCVVPLSLSFTPSAPVRITWQTVNATATAGSDYIASSGSFTFAPGERSSQLTFVVLGDTLFESNETFTVKFSVSGASLGTPSIVATINNDDVAPTPTPTATPRPTATPTATPRPTATPTATPRPTATPVPTPSLSGFAVYQREEKDATDPRYPGIPTSSLVLADFSRKTVKPLGPWNLLFARNPHISPDGSSIVFTAYPNDNSGFDIFLWKIGASTPVNLTANKFVEGEGKDEDASWIDSTTIVFKRSRGGQNYQIYKISLDGQGNSVSIDSVATGPDDTERSGPRVSPDGQFILYWKGTDAAEDLYYVPIGGGTEQPLTQAAVANLSEYYPAPWKTNYALFTRWISTSDQHDQVYALNLSSKAITRLPFNDYTSNNDDACRIDDRYVLFSSDRADADRVDLDLYIGDSLSGKVFTMSDFGMGSVNTTKIRELGADYYGGS